MDNTNKIIAYVNRVIKLLREYYGFSTNMSADSMWSRSTNSKKAKPKEKEEYIDNVEDVEDEENIGREYLDDEDKDG